MIAKSKLICLENFIYLNLSVANISFFSVMFKDLWCLEKPFTSLVWFINWWFVINPKAEQLKTSFREVSVQCMCTVYSIEVTSTASKIFGLNTKNLWQGCKKLKAQNWLTLITCQHFCTNYLQSIMFRRLLFESFLSQSIAQPFILKGICWIYVLNQWIKH